MQSAVSHFVAHLKSASKEYAPKFWDFESLRHRYFRGGLADA